jgi:serine phosphatase RsbU (regulator of sigma subunit)
MAVSKQTQLGQTGSPESAAGPASAGPESQRPVETPTPHPLRIGSPFREAETFTQRLVGVLEGGVVIAAAVGLSLLLPHGDPGAPATVFIVAVVVASLTGGIWAGLSAAVLGVAGIDYFFFRPLHRLGPISAEEATLLGSFVVAAIIAAWTLDRLQRARQRMELELNRSAALSFATTGLSRAKSEADVAAAVVRAGLGPIGALAAAVFVVDPESATLWCAASEGYPEALIGRWRRFPLAADVPAAQAVRERGVVALGTLAERRERYGPVSGGVPTMGSGAAIAVPLIGDDEVLGAVTFHFSDEHDFAGDEIGFLATFALHCSQAFERARAEEGEREARQRAQFLSEATDVLSSSLDYQRTLDEAMRLLIPRFADWAVVDLVTEGGGIDLVAVAHRDPQMVRWARVIRERYPPAVEDETGVGAVIRTRTSVFRPTLDPAEVAAAAVDEGMREALRVLAPRSVIIVPLEVEERVVGAMTLIRSETDRPYSVDDLELAEGLAGRAAAAIDRSRLFADRDHIARSFQQILLPASLPSIEGFELAAAYRPGRAGMDVGGDFYDVFERPGGSFGLAIGDVCGHGPEAAAVMGVARQTIRVAGMGESRPSSILRVVNEALLLGGYERFVSVCDVRVNPIGEAARLTVSSAGHPLPVLVGADRSVRRIGEHGMLLGVQEDPWLADITVDMAPGDLLVLFTDGLVEWPSRAPTDEAFLELLASAAGRSAQDALSAIERWWREGVGSEPRDDAAVLVVRMRERARG